MTLGTDFKGGYDLSPTLQESSGLTALMECIVRRLSTESGALADYPEYGEDLTQYIGTAGVDAASVEAVVSDQCYQEEEVDNVIVDVTLTGETMRVDITGEADDEPFELTISVDALTVSAIIPE